MAKTYQVNGMTRFANRVMKQMARFGLTPPRVVMLTVKGRKSGKEYSAPVSPLELDGERYLVSPYGNMNWVKNARAAGEVTLSQRGTSETVRIEELGPQDSAPVLKAYLARGKITRPYFDVAPDASLEAFAAEAPKHPVFRIVPAGK